MPIDKMPEMTYYAKPDYPTYAYSNLVEGSVWIKALVDKVGDIQEAKLGKTSGSKLLDDAALKVAKKNKFKPALSNGIPYAVWVTYKVGFAIDKE